MRVIDGLESVELAGVVLTIGNFDGVHRGHQAILAAGRRRADAASAELVVMTFDPHPLAILTPEHVPPALTPRDEKLRWLQRCGADVVVVAQSRPELLQITAEEFITEMIVARFHPRAVIEGESFGFGRHRQGHVETLRAVGAEHGFETELVEPIRVALGGHANAVISSSLVRQLAASGTVHQAAVCLGRPYCLSGRIIHGAGRGRSLGFPTANVLPGPQLIPGEGVYAGRAEIDNQPFAAAISIGRNHTFDGSDVSVEAHLLDFDGQPAARPIRLEFIEWIREQRKFDSADALRRQIGRDVARTRKRCKKGDILLFCKNGIPCSSNGLAQQGRTEK